MTIERWRCVLPDDVAVRAVEVATEIADRLRAPDVVGGADHEVIEAAIGAALLHGQLDSQRPGQDWDRTAHELLAYATRIVEGTTPTSAGLFGGLSGVAYGAWTLSHDGVRYQRLIAGLEHNINATAATTADFLARSPVGPASYLSDVITGLAGIGRYLLCRNDNEPTLRKVLAALVELCGSDGDLPHWHVPPRSLAPGSALASGYPRGYLDCGLAHGIAGSLALMSLALTAGIAVEGQKEAIQTVVHWLVAQRADDEWGANWPSAVELPGNDGGPSSPTHAAWCYGSPGVARAMWLAGEALHDEAWRGLAVSAMKSVHARPAAARRIEDSPGLCHGVAGLLMITLRFAHDTGDPTFADAAVSLTRQLLELYDPELPFGYRALSDDGATADKPGLLDGAAGAALALLAAGTDTAPVWDGMLLLS